MFSDNRALPKRTILLSTAAIFAMLPVFAAGEGPSDTARLRWYEQHALTHPGIAERGHELFLDERRTKCVICHKVDGRGGDVGPDLSTIGGKFDRPHLIESLLEPSRQIVEGYRATVVVTNDGLTLSGVVTRRDGGEFTLMDADGKDHRLNQHDIDVMETSPLSMMPTGLADQWSPEQFTDVIAYLESLRGDGKQSPGQATRGRIALPEGFVIETIATGLTGCTALETASDGRVLVCQQTGALRVIKNDVLLDEPMLTLAVDSHWERGLIGVTVHPDFRSIPELFVCYVAAEPYPHHRVSRFTVAGDKIVEGSEKRLLTGDDQRELGGHVPAGHQGGAVHFGPDGRLYIAIGEQTAETPSQRLDTFQGKLLRIDADGSIPSDNPFYEETKDKYRAIWALGLRNPFTFAFQPGTGDILINDVGGKFEEINRGRAGANYGWPVVEHGPTNDRRFEAPMHHYPQASISGGDFAAANLDWPTEYRGRYFFADFVHGWIKTLDPESPGQAETFVTGLNRPVDLRFAPDGSLYVLLRNAWVIDGKFQPGTGSLLKISYR
jgi:putative heme-binding domain-containing protein